MKLPMQAIDAKLAGIEPVGVRKSREKKIEQTLKRNAVNIYLQLQKFLDH